MTKTQLKILEKIQKVIEEQIRNQRKISFSDKADIVRKVVKKYKTVKYYEFKEDVPGARFLGDWIELKSCVRVNLTGARGKYNYADVIEIVF